MAARVRQAGALKALFADAQVDYPPQELLLRGFKDEGELELWAGQAGKPLVLVRTFKVCAKSGVRGPKRKRGDLQVPEGVYRISTLNPVSNFHLSLQVDYPNASDLKRTSGDPGGDIFIHGGCATIGCLPLEDGPVELLYLAVKDARARWNRPVQVHLFPRRLTATALEALAAGEGEPLAAFWRELEVAYRLFEAHHRPLKVAVDPRTGAYLFKNP